MAGAAGLEPATIGFGDRCSTNWNYAPAKWMPIILTNKAKTSVKDAQILNLSNLAIFSRHQWLEIKQKYSRILTTMPAVTGLHDENHTVTRFAQMGGYQESLIVPARF